MEFIAIKFWEFINRSKGWITLSFVIIGTFILRLPTIFIDYIHIDVITSYILAKRDLAGLSFTPNKGWVYHYLVKWSIILFGNSPSSFHFTGIIFVILTVLFIYLLGRKIYNKRNGTIAALLYGFIISSYNTEFLATNAEIIYNLFFVSTFYFFYLCIFEKRYICIFPFIISVILGIFTKFQGSFAFLAILAYLLLIKPAFAITIKTKKIKYYIIIISTMMILFLAIYYDFSYSKIFFQSSLNNSITRMINYVSNRGFSPLLIIGKLLWRSFHFTLYHSIIWIPALYYIYKFFTQKYKKNEKDAYIISIIVFLFLTIFIGGARLSVHYFIPVLPLLSILSANEILRRIDNVKAKKLFFKLIMLPVLFFFIWNVKDVYIAHFKPEWKHEESKIAFLFRIIAIGSHGEYLLPHKSLLPVLQYIGENTTEDDKLLVWPMGTEVIYFSGRRSVEPNYWYNEAALHAIVQKEKNDLSTFNRYEKTIIKKIKKLSPDYFVDVGSTSMIRKVLIYKKNNDPPYYFDINTAPMIRFGSFGGLNNFPKIIDFLNNNYDFAGNFGEAQVWKKRDRNK
ncbi:MAG: glycosyltransferase family 39 protein [Spirochaetota bacterium]|nr:glycosyltransferase family 39 protein [Spirochaetota bacterium]